MEDNTRRYEDDFDLAPLFIRDLSGIKLRNIITLYTPATDRPPVGVVADDNFQPPIPIQVTNCFQLRRIFFPIHQANHIPDGFCVILPIHTIK